MINYIVHERQIMSINIGHMQCHVSPLFVNGQNMLQSTSFNLIFKNGGRVIGSSSKRKETRDM